MDTTSPIMTPNPLVDLCVRTVCGNAFWMPQLMATTALLLTLLAPELAAAQDRRSEQAIKHRRAAFTLMATYTNRLVQMAEGGRPYDAAQALNDAKVLESISRLPWEGFLPGSDKGDTRARDDIWLEDERFQQQARTLQGSATALAKAAETMDVAQLRAALVSLRDACNACHKAFRKD